MRSDPTVYKWARRGELHDIDVTLLETLFDATGTPRECFERAWEDTCYMIVYQYAEDGLDLDRYPARGKRWHY